jgi:hypothetical protein
MWLAMAIIYETKDSKGQSHTYLVAEGYAFILGGQNPTGNESHYHFIGGAALHKDFDIAYEECEPILKTSYPVFVQPGSLASINLEQIARNPPAIGGYLIVRNPKQPIHDPRNGYELLRGKITMAKKLEELC